MKAFVTGGNGFIGRELVKGLLREGYEEIKIYGLGCNPTRDWKDGGETITESGDVLDYYNLARSMRGHDLVFHFAANPNVSPTPNDPHFLQGTSATHTVLRAMKEVGAKRIVFASSSVVYGDTNSLEPIPESAPFAPISLYGASKVAGEAMIRAYCSVYGMRALLLRFANIVGPKPTHGILHNWCEALAVDPKVLKVCGDGSQTKSYLHVDDCVAAILWILRCQTDFNIKPGFVEAINIGNTDTISVSEIAKMMVAKFGRSETGVFYAGGRAGWPGDVPKVFMDISRLKAMGWRPMLNSHDAVEKSIREMV